jgi:ferrous iron transport protein B
VIVDVVDATNLERNLALTLQLAAMGKPMIVCLNFWDDTVHKGVAIDVPALEALLGVPVVAASALEGSGVSDLVAALPRAALPREDGARGARRRGLLSSIPATGGGK